MMHQRWQGRRVLVTGAAGFIGSHLAEGLLAAGAEVAAFVRYNSRRNTGFIGQISDDADRLRIAFGDVRDLESLSSAMRDVEFVFHLAALVSIPYSYLNPREVFEVNALGTLNVLAAAKDHKVEKVVLMSTSEVYGTARYVPIDESHPLQAQSPYSASKIAAEKLGESFYRCYDLPIAIARPFNAYGPRQSNRAVIPTIIVQALTQQEIRLGATWPTRDFTFVTDTANGLMMIADCDKSSGEVINLGSGEEISIGDLASKITSLIGRDVPIRCEEQRLRPEKSEVERLCASTTKAKQLLGWQPTIPLEEGLRLTIQWIRSSLDLYEPDVYAV